MTITGWSSRGHDLLRRRPSARGGAGRRRTRRRGGARRCTRRARWRRPGAKSLAISSLACATAHSAHFRSSRIFLLDPLDAASGRRPSSGTRRGSRSSRAGPVGSRALTSRRWRLASSTARVQALDLRLDLRASRRAGARTPSACRRRPAPDPTATPGLPAMPLSTTPRGMLASLGRRTRPSGRRRRARGGVAAAHRPSPNRSAMSSPIASTHSSARSPLRAHLDDGPLRPAEEQHAHHALAVGALVVARDLDLAGVPRRELHELRRRAGVEAELIDDREARARLAHGFSPEVLDCAAAGAGSELRARSAPSAGGRRGDALELERRSIDRRRALVAGADALGRARRAGLARRRGAARRSTRRCAPTSSRASASAMATERCRPPVQPMAMVR